MWWYDKDGTVQKITECHMEVYSDAAKNACDIGSSKFY